MSRLSQRLQLFSGCMNVLLVFLVLLMLTDRLTFRTSTTEREPQAPVDRTLRDSTNAEWWDLHLRSGKSYDNEGKRDTELLKTVTLQRNELSEILTRQLNRLGALQCEKAEEVNERGAYCLKEAEKQQGFDHINSDLFASLSGHLKGKSLASFGEGSGVYIQRMRDSGLLTRVDAFDAAPFVDKTTEGRVQFLDLTVPNYGLPLYDWIMSIETAEHIPAIYEHVFIDNIARHAREGIIMSWAVPGQPGVSHINCRPFDYVKRKMEEIGFRHDEKMSTHFKAQGVGCLKTNLNLFVREANRPMNEIFS